MSTRRRPKRPQPRRRPLAKQRNEASEGRTRTCIAGGGDKPPAGLIRFALSPDGVVVPDLAEKLGGRGAWVSADRASLARAMSKGLFARAFKSKAEAPGDLAEAVEAGLERRALDALGLARRTGEAVLGFDKVKEALTKERVGVLIAASDAADDGRDKLARLGKGIFRHQGFESAILSAALGKDGVKHAALLKGAAARRFEREAARLDGFRAGVGVTPQEIEFGPE
ncbi:MAG: RNA-binding protein [Parvularculaceae bacterium]